VLFRSQLGLESTNPAIESLGEGRSSFAGFAIGLAAICVLFQQPILFQTLTICWIIVFAGRVIHFLVDGGFREKVLFNLLRLVLAGGLAGYSFVQNGLPEFQFALPTSNMGWVPFIAAVITILFGMIAFVLPRMALAMMRLRTNDSVISAKGEPRGMLAGFYLGVGGVLAMNPDVVGVPGVFIGFALATCWTLTAFGRMISMLSDRGNNLFNWISLLMELALAALPLVVIFNLVQ